MGWDPTFMGLNPNFVGLGPHFFVGLGPHFYEARPQIVFNGCEACPPKKCLIELRKHQSAHSCSDFRSLSHSALLFNGSIFKELIPTFVREIDAADDD